MINDENGVEQPKNTFSMEFFDWIEAAMTPEEFGGYLKGCALKHLRRCDDTRSRRSSTAYSQLS